MWLPVFSGDFLKNELQLFPVRSIWLRSFLLLKNNSPLLVVSPAPPFLRAPHPPPSHLYLHPSPHPPPNLHPHPHPTPTPTPATKLFWPTCSTWWAVKELAQRYYFSCVSDSFWLQFAKSNPLTLLLKTGQLKLALRPLSEHAKCYHSGPHPTSILVSLLLALCTPEIHNQS